MEQVGKVWLAGAGPGDAGLLTVKTKALMEQADVVIYDALISTEILSMIPVHTKKINVGKRASHHLVPQEEINQIILEEALLGNNVLRLKGGDPFIFGRGGEELELLVQAEIPFEIVPGITSVTAVPAYAGIPITHRDYTSSFYVVTGHPREGKESTIHYETLVHMDATLIFLMGVSSMHIICEQLIEAGMDPLTPAAVLENGTMAKQRKVVSTVANLVVDTEKEKIHTPAIIVVGKVCGLSKAFQWTQNRPLNGRQILLTRPKHLVSELAIRLRNLGAQVIELPSIVIKALPNKANFEKAISDIQGLKEVWIVFTSPTGVAVFFENLMDMKWDIRSLLSQTKIHIGVIGSATEKALKKHLIFPDLMPENYSAEQLGRALAQEVKQKVPVFIFRAEEGSVLLTPPLDEQGIPWVDVPLYQTIAKADETLKESLMKQLIQGEIDWVTFTSASTVRGFMDTFDGMDVSCIHAICIGEQTAKEAQKHGIKVTISKEATMDSMIGSMLEQE
ncbi:MAG: uroporphyrinogen-III C-methyltransferase [Lachnospiraceae bacterium]